jgi:hypothetical protein
LARLLDDEAKGVVDWTAVISPTKTHEAAPSAMAGRGEWGTLSQRSGHLCPARWGRAVRTARAVREWRDVCEQQRRGQGTDATRVDPR